MHVGWFEVDPSWLLKGISSLVVVAVGIVCFVKNIAAKYFEVDTSFEGSCRTRRDAMPGPAADACAVCREPAAKKKCSRCKSVRYCSTKCQTEHWKSGHKLNCKQATEVIASPKVEFKAPSATDRRFPEIALVPVSGSFKSTKKPRDVLFPYDEFIKLYNCDMASFPPCGLLNCGNSCFANVVLQCLTYTKPLVSYLLDKGHRGECRHNNWCFLCVFQQHVERASQSSQAFSPLNILSRLPSFGGNLGYGKQEDAHEFMRIVVDAMQSVCLDEFGGEKALSTASQETTLIQHIFGGQLQSQVICTKCSKVSNQLENLMDLTVEIHGEVESLEECLDQFTAKEWLDGENMYKCDGCKDYVEALKRLTIKRAPNILTIALKRFQSGRFGKLNKRVTFPELLNLSPYMSENGDGSDIYQLYAVVVHVDMLNASFFGHYICYTKDFHGNWYRVDDCKVTRVEVDEVLFQGAYMLLYSRISVRTSHTLLTKPSKEAQSISNDYSSYADETENCGSSLDLLAEKISDSQGVECRDTENAKFVVTPCDIEDETKNCGSSLDLLAEKVSDSQGVKCRDIEDAEFVVSPCDSEISNDIPIIENGFSSQVNSEAARPAANVYSSGSYSFPKIEASSCQNVALDPSCNGSQNQDQGVMNVVRHDNGAAVPMDISEGEDDQSAEPTSNNTMEVATDSRLVKIESFSSEATSMRSGLKRESPFHGLDVGDGTGAKRAEVSNGY